MAGFCDTYDLRSLLTEPKCDENPENPTCIDLILLNFHNSCVFETGLSDFHQMTLTLMKVLFKGFNQESQTIGTIDISKTKYLEKNCCPNF